MKNKKKSIIILLIALVVLIIVALVATNKTDEPITEEPADEIYQVTSFPSSDITKMEFVSENETDIYTRTESGWQLEGSTLPIDQNALAYSCGIIANFSSTQVFDETTNAYGTDTSSKKVIATLSDNSTVTFTFGSNTPDNIFTYVKVEGSDADGIYSMPVSTANSFVLTKDTAAFKGFEQIEFQTLNKIVINQKDYQNLVLEVPTEEQVISQNLQGVSTLIMDSPYKNKTIFMQNLVDDVFSTITTMSFGELIESDCTDLAKYGLSDPFLTIEIISNNGELKLQVGDKADETNYYVKNEDDNHVFLMSEELLAPFIDVDCYSFLNKFIMLNSIDEVSSIKISTDTDTYELKQNSINGKDIGEEQYTNLYKSVISIQLSLYTDKVDNTNQVEYQQYDFTFNDGSTKSYTFYSYDDQYCTYYDPDAEMWAFVSKAELDAVISNIQSFIN